MKKFFQIIKLTAIMIVLSLLLIGASSLLRFTFINSVKVWQKNLTITTEQNPTLLQNNLATANDNTSNFWHKNLTTFKITQPIFCQKNLTTLVNSQSLLGQKSLTTLSLSTTLTEARYQRITSDTPLLKSTNDTDTSIANTLFLLPKSYFVKILRTVTLDSGAEGYYVRYNTYEGYAMKSAFSGAMSDNTTSQSGIKITLSSDAGSYLRSTPEISDTNAKILIPASTDGLVLIGKIYGDTPSDGSSDLWYFVEYSTGPTTTYTGYVYSERCILSSPLTDLILDTDIIEGKTDATTTLPTQDLSQESNLNLTQTPNTTPTLMWVVAIIFIIPIVVVFIMLMKRPKQFANDYELIANNGNSTDTFDFDETYAPSILKNKTPRKFPKFNHSKLDELSRFIKLDTSLETSESLDPSENSSTYHPQHEDFKRQSSFINSQNHPTFRLKTPKKPLKFARNIKIASKSLEKNTICPVFSPNSNEIHPKTLENSIFTSQNDENPLKNTFSPHKNTNNDILITTSNDLPPFSDAFATVNDTSAALSNSNFQKSTFNSDDFSNPQVAVEKTKKPSNFFKNILNRKAKKQKINKNRLRDEFRPTVLASDDYFEFADSFELTTPMNSHLIFKNTQHPHHSRSGRQINKR